MNYEKINSKAVIGIAALLTPVLSLWIIGREDYRIMNPASVFPSVDGLKLFVFRQIQNEHFST